MVKSFSTALITRANLALALSLHHPFRCSKKVFTPLHYVFIFVVYILTWHVCAVCARAEPIRTRDVVTRLKVLDDGERMTLIAEFADAYGPLLARTLRTRKPKYEAELMNRLLTAAVAIFGSEQHTMEVLQRTRFFSKTSKPQRR